MDWFAPYFWWGRWLLLHRHSLQGGSLLWLKTTTTWSRFFMVRGYCSYWAAEIETHSHQAMFAWQRMQSEESTAIMAIGLKITVIYYATIYRKVTCIPLWTCTYKLLHTMHGKRQIRTKNNRRNIMGPFKLLMETAAEHEHQHWFHTCCSCDAGDPPPILLYYITSTLSVISSVLFCSLLFCSVLFSSVLFHSHQTYKCVK